MNQTSRRFGRASIDDATVTRILRACSSASHISVASSADQQVHMGGLPRSSAPASWCGTSTNTKLGCQAASEHRDESPPGNLILFKHDRGLHGDFAFWVSIPLTQCSQADTQNPATEPMAKPKDCRVSRGRCPGHLRAACGFQRRIQHGSLQAAQASQGPVCLLASIPGKASKLTIGGQSLFH
jgi:hypothetical protein